jgi:hypothetical protein
VTYSPGPVPNEPKQLGLYVRGELEKIANELREMPQLRLKELHAEPAKPRDGTVVLADGTDWDPGSGAGFYGRYGAAWVKLG